MMKDDASRYGWISIALHWITAIAVIYLYISGEQIEGAPRGAARTDTIWLHVSIGMMVLLPVLFRMYWRAASGTPERAPQAILFSFLATWIPILMLIAVFVAMITGVLLPWSVGNPVYVFDFFEIASPFASSRDFHELMEEAHELSSHALLPLFALHLLGTLKHLVIDRDNTLTRMLRVARED